MRESISPDTVRHYERLGLLEPPARGEGGFRLYRDDAIRRVQALGVFRGDL